MKIGLDTTFLLQATVNDHPGNLAAMSEVASRVAADDTFVLAPQLLTEFVHVVTDSRRFENPLSVSDALQQAREW